MTPANEELVEQIRAALDAPPNARAISDLQKIRGYLRTHFGDGDDAHLLACVDEVICRNAIAEPGDPVSMATLSDAADAKQLRDRVRALETLVRQLEEERDAANLKAMATEVDAAAIVECEQGDLHEALDKVRELEAELRGLPEAVAITELASTISIESCEQQRAEIAELNVRLSGWQTWARTTHDRITPFDERLPDWRWHAMTDDTVRTTVDLQIDTLRKSENRQPHAALHIAGHVVELVPLYGIPSSNLDGNNILRSIHESVIEAVTRENRAPRYTALPASDYDKLLDYLPTVAPIHVPEPKHAA